MVKANSLRKRYVLFEIRGAELPEQQLKHALYAEALKFFGEYGLSFAALKLVEYEEKNKPGILRCERSHLEPVLGFLALVDSLDRKPARVLSLRSSGTIAGLGRG
jgi:RNase P/RNase MRP subunit POP5